MLREKKLSSSEIPEGISLTIRDRVDWPYLISYAINTLFLVMRKPDTNEYDTTRVVNYIDSLIPEAIKDNEYKIEIKNNSKTINIDKRPKFGGVKMNIEFCKKLGLPIYEEDIQIKPEIKFNIIINLLNRLGIITKKEYVEKATGRRFIEETPVGDTTEIKTN